MTCAANNTSQHSLQNALNAGGSKLLCMGVQGFAASARLQKIFCIVLGCLRDLEVLKSLVCLSLQQRWRVYGCGHKLDAMRLLTYS